MAVCEECWRRAAELVMHMGGSQSERYREVLKEHEHQMATEPKKTRAKKRNYAAELERLTQYCKISITVMSELTAKTPNEFMNGQITALKAVLRQLGATEE